jgi:two-component system LytT family sensor kinase
MNFKKLHTTLLFPFRKLLWLLIILVVTIQLVVIIYNNYSGYYPLEDFQHFLFRFFRGISLSLMASFFIAYPDLFVINYLNRFAPWEKKMLKRLLIQFSAAVLIAVVIAICFTLFAHLLRPYEHALGNVLFNNALIFAVVNILLMAILEGMIFSMESRKSKLMADQLREELSEIKFELLKSQINPHFMFNSLNVLSGLVSNDAKKAEQFIDEFSHIYRYVLETIERPVSTLEKELNFMRSYMYLQQMRYGNNLTYSVDIPASLLDLLLPPLSLQVVLENAIKHNIVNDTSPLNIKIYCENHEFVISNCIQPKVSKSRSTGLGLKNLKKRYALISDQTPSFRIVDNNYVAKLPLLKDDEDGQE